MKFILNNFNRNNQKWSCKTKIIDLKWVRFLYYNRKQEDKLMRRMLIKEWVNNITQEGFINNKSTYLFLKLNIIIVKK